MLDQARVDSTTLDGSAVLAQVREYLATHAGVASSSLDGLLNNAHTGRAARSVERAPVWERSHFLCRVWRQ